MHRPKRTISCLLQLSTADLPGLRGRILVQGDDLARQFTNARELVELLRLLIRTEGAPSNGAQATSAHPGEAHGIDPPPTGEP